MRIPFILMILWGSITTHARQLHFPDDFKAGIQLFPGMREGPGTEGFAKQAGLTGSKGVVKDSRLISALLDLPVTPDMVRRLYYERYQGIKDTKEVAGIMVAEFRSPGAVEDIISSLKFSGHKTYLRKDRFLIVIWSEEAGDGPAQTVKRLGTYYINNLQAAGIPDNRVAAPLIVETQTVPRVVGKLTNDNDHMERELEQQAFDDMEANAYEPAIEGYLKVLEKNDQNSRAYYNLAWIYTKNGRLHDAIEISKKALEHLPFRELHKFYRYIGNCYTELDSLDRGAVYLARALADKPDEYLTVYNYGYNRYIARDYSKAIPLLQQSLYMKDRDLQRLDDTYFYIATSLSESGNVKASLPYFDSAIVITPFDNYFFNKAEAYSRLLLNETAIEVCDTGLQYNPNSANLYFKRHQLYRTLGDEKKSLQSLTRAYELDPEDPDILMDFSVWLGRENRVTEALNLYRKALLKSERKGSIYSNMASLFAANKLTADSAIHYHELAIEDMPDNFVTFFNYGNCLKDLERFPEAIQMYEKAYALNAENDVVIGNMAVVYMQMGQVSTAKKWLENGLSKFPDDFEMNALMSRIALSDEKNYTDAEQYANTALKNVPPGKNRLTVISIRANARQMQGKYEDAIYDYLELLNKMSAHAQKENADIYSNIGYCYLYLKDYQSAESYFAECLNHASDIDPVLGMLFVKYFANDERGIRKYKKMARKIYPLVRKGATGLKQLEAEGYSYSDELYQIVDRIFLK